MSNQAPRAMRNRTTSGDSRIRYWVEVDSWSTSRASTSAPRSTRNSATSTVCAQWSGVLPSPSRAWTSDGSASTSSRSRSSMPRLAAANTSTTAPRATSGAASSGVSLVSRIPNGPAHHELLRLMSAPNSSRTSSSGMFFDARVTGGLSNQLIGALMTARTSSCAVSSSRTRAASPAWSAARNSLIAGVRSTRASYCQAASARAARGRERIAAFWIAFGETAPEPLDALRGRAVREAIGRDVSGRHALEAIVANRRGGTQAVVGIARFELHLAVCGAARLRGDVSPDAGVAVRLQFHEHRYLICRLRLCALGCAHALFDAGQPLDVMTDLVGEDVRAGEIAACAEAVLQLLKESEIEVHLLVLRTVERACCGLGEAARRLNRVAEQHGACRLVPLHTRAPAVLHVLHHRVDKIDLAFFGRRRIGAARSSDGERTVVR